MVKHATGFQTSTHGFPFPNWFPVGSPVVVIPTPFGKLTIGDANMGLCGGMVFAAIDYYLYGLPRPEKLSEPVFRYFCTRLIDSWNMPFGVMKYYDGQRRPSASRTVAGVRVLDGLMRKTALEEWPRIRAALDTGLPAALGLVNAHSFSPKQLAKNHQVLAHGYEVDGDEVTLHVYDPNYPADHDAELTFNLADPDGPGTVRHSCEGATIRGIFLTDYSRPSIEPVV